LATRPKPDAELVGLTWSLTPREGAATGEDAGWYKSPVVLGIGVLAITVILYIVI
jgi:SSS family solute:Na+ symporter